MIRVPFKKIKEQYNIAEVEKYILDNFQDLRTSDVIKLRSLIIKMRRDTMAFTEKVLKALYRPGHSFHMALLMTKRNIRGKNSAVDKFDSWVKFLDKITEYRDNQIRAIKRQKKRSYR